MTSPPSNFRSFSLLAADWCRAIRWYTFLPLLVCAGCGDGRPALFPVRGEVVFSSGEPVREATIEFVPADSSPSPRGKTDSMGQFTLGTYESDDGAPAGDYRVLVLHVLPPRAAESVRKLGEEHADHGARIPLVSLKYASPKTSELTCSVQPLSDNKVKLVVDQR